MAQNPNVNSIDDMLIKLDNLFKSHYLNLYKRKCKCTYAELIKKIKPYRKIPKAKFPKVN